MDEATANEIAFWLLVPPFGLILWGVCIYGFALVSREILRIILNTIRDWNYR